MPRILLIEDDANVRMLMEHVLLRANYEVDVANTVEQAKTMLQARGYDLVIADGRLPDGNGMMLADMADKQGIPNFIATAYGFDLMKEGLGQFEFLLKPVRPDELLRAVETALSGTSIRQSSR